MSRSDFAKPPISAVFARRQTTDVASANERQILDLVRRHRGASRADLARASGLTGQSLTRIVDGLIERGLVRFGPLEARGRGQHSSPVYIREDGAYTFGVSMMTDALSLGLMDFDGHIVEHAYTRLDVNDVEAVTRTVRAFMDGAIGRHRLDRKRILGLGVAITGYFLGDGAKVNPPAQLDAWALIDCAAVLERALDLPVWVDNDGNAAAVGESLSGIGAELDSFAYLFFSVGFGGGLVLNRKPYRGFNGNAGEFGTILQSDHMSPNLEILRDYVSRGGHAFSDLGEMLDQFDPAWPGVEAWVQEAARSLDLVISAISAVADVEAIIFGGRIPRSLVDRLLPGLSFINPTRRQHRRPVPRLLASSVQHDAAMMGAAAMPLKDLFYS